MVQEVQTSAVLPVVVNAMEVHARQAGVQTAAAKLLRTLAATGGSLRANLVAAGALPAITAALRSHGGAAEVAALCELSSEICSARGAPHGSRRAMCEALATTGTLRAVLRALRAHVSHEPAVGAACSLLLSFQEEFEGGTQPLPLMAALRSQDTLLVLQEAQRRFSGNAAVQLGATWGVGIGRASRKQQQRGREGTPRPRWT